MEASPAVKADVSRAAGLSPADVTMKRLLRVPIDGPRGSIVAARSAFTASIAVSAVRCLLTYVVLPLLAPLLDLTGGVGPALGLAIGCVSAVAIVISMRRFWAADHRWRWGYTTVGGLILALLGVQAIGDIATLVG